MIQARDYPTDSFVIQPSETDLTGRLSMPALVGLMQEAANLNAARLGFSINDLNVLGLGWVLMRLKINVLHWPAEDDTFRIATFPTHRDRYFISRDYHGFDPSGRVVMRASSTWLTFSTQTRAMSPLPDLMQAAYIDPRPFLPKLPSKLRFVGEPIHADTCRVQEQYLDQNQHTNNSAYVLMLIAALPPALAAPLELAGLDLFFKTETFLDDELRIETAPTDDPNQFFHRLTRPADGKEILTARTDWRLRADEV